MISSELKDKIYQFIENAITVEQLEEWLVPRLPTFLASPNSADSEVVAVIELSLAEINDDIRTEDEFRILLREVMQERDTLVLYSPSLSETVSSSSYQPSLYLDLDAAIQTPRLVLDFTGMAVAQ